MGHILPKFGEGDSHCSRFLRLCHSKESFVA
jgi:hypothetical protein